MYFDLDTSAEIISGCPTIVGGGAFNQDYNVKISRGTMEMPEEAKFKSK